MADPPTGIEPRRKRWQEVTARLRSRVAPDRDLREHCAAGQNEPTEESNFVINARIRASWDRMMRPVGRGLARAPVSADAVTIGGVLVQVWAAYLIVEGALVAAAFVTLAAAVADVVDGAMAKARGLMRKFGALLDSTTDRLSDALVFAAAAWLYGVDPDVGRHDEPWVAGVALIALVASFLVSYVKARAEGLGFDCNVGIAERAERVSIVILGLLFDLLPVALVILAVLAVITFAQRLVHVLRQEQGAS